MGAIVRRLAILLGVTAACALALSLSGADTAAADTGYRFMQFNMCGNSDKCPNQGKADPNSGVVPAIRNSIESHRPLAVSLNEVCESQFATLLWTLNDPGSPWSMEGHWVATKTRDTDPVKDDNKCENDRYGIAILTRHQVLIGPAAWPLRHTVNYETRRLLCVVSDEPRDTAFCTTHITNSDTTGYKDDQIEDVWKVVDPWARDGIPVVLMGDFNVPPYDPSLDRLYDPAHPWGEGRFQEVDENQCSPQARCNEEDTIGDEKWDYIFVSFKQWRAVDGDATSSVFSDHDPLHGSAWLIH